MLTYPLSKESGRSLYEQLYEGIRRDILSGTLPAHQRLPSKRALARHLQVSVATVESGFVRHSSAALARELILLHAERSVRIAGDRYDFRQNTSRVEGRRR